MTARGAGSGGGESDHFRDAGSNTRTAAVGTLLAPSNPPITKMRPASVTAAGELSVAPGSLDTVRQARPSKRSTFRVPGPPST